MSLTPPRNRSAFPAATSPADHLAEAPSATACHSLITSRKHLPPPHSLITARKHLPLPDLPPIHQRKVLAPGPQRLAHAQPIARSITKSFATARRRARARARTSSTVRLARPRGPASPWAASTDHLAELVGLTFGDERLALHLLVVLELGLEELDHLDRRTAHASDRDTRVVVGREHLLDAAGTNREAHESHGGRRPSPRRRHSGSRRPSCRAASRNGHRPPSRSRAGSWCGLTPSQEIGERRTRVGDSWRTTATRSVRTSGTEPAEAVKEGSASTRSTAIPAELVVTVEVGRTPGGSRSASSATWPIAIVAVEAEDAETSPGDVIVVDVVGIGIASRWRTRRLGVEHSSNASSVSPYFRFR